MKGPLCTGWRNPTRLCSDAYGGSSWLNDTRSENRKCRRSGHFGNDSLACRRFGKEAMKNREVVSSTVVELTRVNHLSDRSGLRGDDSVPRAIGRTAGTTAMNQVFCHHPSLIHGREFRCPDCDVKVGPIPSVSMSPSPPAPPTDKSWLVRFAKAIGTLLRQVPPRNRDSGWGSAVLLQVESAGGPTGTGRLRASTPRRGPESIVRGPYEGGLKGWAIWTCREHAGRMARTAGGACLKQICLVCKQEAEWKYKNGWGILACAGWFAGSCDGHPLGVIFPSVGDVRRPGDVADVNATYADWLTKRIRALWPPEKSAWVGRVDARHCQASLGLKGP